MVWLATIDDLDFLCDLTREFNDKHFPVPLNEAKTRQTIKTLLELDESIVLRSDKGYIAGIIEEDPFRDWVVLVEKGWFAKDRSGLKLLNEFIEWGEDNLYIDEIRVGHLGSNPKVHRLLERKGFTLAEQSMRLLM